MHAVASTGDALKLSGKRYTEGDGPCMDRAGTASPRASENGDHLSIDALVKRRRGSVDCARRSSSESD